MSLLPHFIPPTSLLSTLIVIVLDWTRPWTFVEELQTWLTWIEAWSKGDGARELEIIREEGRERRESPSYFAGSIVSNGVLSTISFTALL